MSTADRAWKSISCRSSFPTGSSNEIEIIGCPPIIAGPFSSNGKRVPSVARHVLIAQLLASTFFFSVAFHQHSHKVKTVSSQGKTIILEGAGEGGEMNGPRVLPPKNSTNGNTVRDSKETMTTPFDRKKVRKKRRRLTCLNGYDVSITSQPPQSSLRRIRQRQQQQQEPFLFVLNS